MIGFPRIINEKAARVVAGVVAVTALAVAAALESVLALCLGCQAFALLMRAGVIPDAVCAGCADLWARR